MMHLTKNLCGDLLGFLGLYEKTKDIQEARKDQHRMKGRDEMQTEDFQGPTSYALTKDENYIFFECLSSRDENGAETDGTKCCHICFYIFMRK
jgi:hypothetical protein